MNTQPMFPTWQEYQALEAYIAELEATVDYLREDNEHLTEIVRAYSEEFEMTPDELLHYEV